MKRVLFAFLACILACAEAQAQHTGANGGYSGNGVGFHLGRGGQAPAAAGSVYYFNNAGSDGDNCLSQATACQSISRANAIVPANSTILFNGGNSFTGPLTSAQVTVGVYGSGTVTISSGASATCITSPTAVIVTTSISCTGGANAFMTDGDNQPITGFPTWPTALYDAVGGKTWVTWSGSADNVNRFWYVATFDPVNGWNPGAASQGYKIAANANTDGHGSPGVVMDQYGYVHAFGGVHNGSALQYSVSSASRNPGTWTACTGISGTGLTFAQPILVNGVIYLWSTSSNNGQSIVLFTGTPSSSGGCITSWTSVGTIVLTTPTLTFMWMGNSIVRSALICFPWTYNNQTATQQYENDVYYGCYDTANGSFQNIQGTTIVASGSLPINRTTAQASFEVFATSAITRSTNIPSQALDANGVIHVLYTDGALSGNTGQGTFTEYDTYYSGGAWSAGIAVGGTTPNFFYPQALVNSPAGVHAYWMNSAYVAQEATSASLGSWGAVNSINPAPTLLVGWGVYPVQNASQYIEAIGGLLSGDASADFANPLFALGDLGITQTPFNLISSSLIGYWPLSSSTTNWGTNTTTDQSSSGLNGTISGGLTSSNQAPCQVGTGINFPSSGTVSFGTSVTLKPTFPFTIMAWANTTSYAGFPQLFYNDFQNNTGSWGAGIGYVSTTPFMIAIYGAVEGAANAQYATEAFVSPAAGSWAHTTAIFNGSQSIDVRINGQENSGTTAGTLATLTYNGNPAELSPAGAPYDGTVCELRMYNRALAPWEDMQIYLQGIQGHS